MVEPPIDFLVNLSLFLAGFGRTGGQRLMWEAHCLHSVGSPYREMPYLELC